MKVKNTTLCTMFSSFVSIGSSNVFAEVNHLDNERSFGEYGEQNIENSDRDYLNLAFSKSKSNVSDDQRIALKRYIKSIAHDGSVMKFVVVAWSDFDYPVSPSEELSAFDRKLADDRKSEVLRVLRELGESRVESYSMAVHPSWLSKAFGTQEAFLKGESTDLDQDYQAMTMVRISDQIRTRGGPGKVVVVAVHRM